jgi:hypothetical protein
MRDFNNILNLLTSGELLHVGFKTVRANRQYTLGTIFLTLCMLVIKTHMDQAGIDDSQKKKGADSVADYYGIESLQLAWIQGRNRCKALSLCVSRQQEWHK